MGIFDKLKQARNFLSGGGANLSVSFDKPYYVQGEPIQLVINCQVGDRDINVRNVYLNVRATETVKVKVRETRTTGTSHTSQTPSVHHSRERTETETYVSFKLDHQVAPAQNLMAGENYEWAVRFDLPEDVMPTYLGKNATHIWKVFAGLNTSGNDPDSGWQEFQLFGAIKPYN